ncbi:DUF4132 domain-containing protein [Spirillospora sp. NPDC029432]|uniref:DUF4132 domain-containing protein n=1 Tax=Spirillospora sp. NPDC029432 TaxID=3154599 RepID=UPI003457239E
MSDQPRDEDVLVIPDAWRDALLPRRGGRTPVPETAPDGAEAERIRHALEVARPDVETVLAYGTTDRRLALAAEGYLRGEPDALGAAVVAVAETRIRTGAPYATDPAWVDFLAAEHGLAFAARAFAEFDGIQAPWHDSVADWPWAVLHDGWSTRRAHWTLNEPGRRMRALLAAAGDDEYAAAVEGLARHRGPRLQRLVVSFLVPTRQDWVDECCDEPEPRDYWASDEPLLLWCALGDEARLERLGPLARVEYGTRLRPVVATLVGELGAAAAPALAAALHDETWYHDPAEAAGRRRALLEGLGAIPTDEAFRLVIEALGRPQVLVAAAEMCERFPARALRVLPEFGGGTSERARLAAGLLNACARARPELLERAGSETRAAVEAVLEGMVAEAPAAEVPKALLKAAGTATPVWAPPGALPQVLLKGRERALPLAATGHLIGALTRATPRRKPNAAVRDALDALDPRSLFEFGWALLGLWRAAGEPDRAGWALAQLGWTGGDEAVRRLGAMARSWTGQEGIRLPLDGLDVLAGSGGDVGLIQLHLVAAKAKPKRLKKKAAKLLAAAAEARGLTPDQLGDRLVPDLGLDAEGGMALDYGPRRFTVGFDEQLRPYVVDGSGKPRKTLPKPGAKDDPELAPAAYAAFTGLKKDVRAAAPEQIRRLERAMCEQRRWETGDFRALFVEHPLLWHIVRRLVWLHEDDAAGEGGKVTAFRVAEDRTLADAADETLAPPAAGGVRIAHPLHLGEAVKAWGDVFADYEIVQPFAQLGRPVYALTEEERGASVLERVKDVTVPTGRLLGLERDGWARDTAEDGGVQHALVRELPGGTVRIHVNPGFPVWSPADWKEQTIGAVSVRGGRAPAAPHRFDALDDVTASELLLTLSTLTEGSVQ